MTGSLRSTARNPIAVFLMGVLTLVFLIIGVGAGGSGGRFPDIFKGINVNDVVTAGHHTVDAGTFKRIFDSRKAELEQQYRQSFTPDFLAENGVDEQVLSGLAQEKSLVELLNRNGVRASDAMVTREIRQFPVALNPATGQFDEKRFAEWLRANGLDARDIDGEVRDSLAMRHFADAAQRGMPSPRIYGALAAVQQLENRDFSYFIMDQHAVPMPALPTDAQLTAYVNAHRVEQTLPETRTFTLVRFSAKALEASVPVSQADLEAEFKLKKDTLGAPETRSFVQIPVKSAAQGADALARLQRGEDPAAVARAEGTAPIAIEDKPASALPDAKLAAGVFAMQANAVQQLQGDLGASVVKVTKITPGRVVTLDQVRPQMEAAVRTRLAAAKVYAITEAFTKARDEGASIADAARQVGATAETVGPVTDRGIDLNGQPTAAVLGPKVLKAVFAEPAGGSGTEVTSSSPGEYFALKVEKITPPGVPPIEGRKPALIQAYMRDSLITALQAKADALAAGMRQGGTIEAAAAQVNGHVAHQVALQRRGAEQAVQTFGEDVLQAVFSSKPGAVFVARGPSGFYVVRLDAVRPGDPNDLARFTQIAVPQMGQHYGGELIGTTQNFAQVTIKPNTNLTLARRAISVSQETIDKLNASAKPAGAKPATPAPKSTGLAQ